MGPLRDRHGRPAGGGVTSLKSLFEAAEAGDRLVVTGPHYEWLERLEHEQFPSQAALFHVARTLLRQFKRPRVGRISPSAMGMCDRRVIFGYAGAPQLAPDTGLSEIFDHGTESHVRWQIEGITMGWMKAGEVWHEDPDLLIGGSTDGVLYDDSLFELKSGAPSVFNKVVRDLREPKRENLMQVDTYFLMMGTDWASVVYEDRAYGNFHEFRIARDAKRERVVLKLLRKYKAHIEADELPQMLAPCEEKMGTTYKQCPYRKICPLMKSVSHAMETGRAAGQEDVGRPIPIGMEMPEWVTEFLSILEEQEVKHGA